MEILLNTFWLFVTIAAFLFWRTGKYRSSLRSRQTTPLGILALISALILLFPVISVTDDLHAEMAVMEDGSGAAMKARALSQGSSHHGKLSFTPFVSSLFDFSSVQMVAFSRVIPQEIHLRSHTPVRPTQARAPPVSQTNLA